jgi:hypothetical protein
MMRLSYAAVALAAALAAGCSASEGGAAAPTAPTPAPSSSGSTGGSPTPQSCLPAAPSNFKVTTNDSTRVFTWNAVPNVQDYFIQIARVGSNDGYLVDTNTSQTTYTWSGHPPASYWARVYARNSCGSGANSEQLFFN